MIRRRYVVPALVLGSAALMVGEARADFVIPATAGQPGIYSFVNNPNPRGTLTQPLPPPAIYWLWFSDVFIWRTTTPNTPLEWDIPLVFNGRAGHNNKWGISVMVSGDTECFAQWWPDDVPGSGPIGTVPTSRPDAGSLLLTTPATCFDGADCTTSFATVQVSCLVPAGGFVGPVSYWIIDMGP